MATRKNATDLTDVEKREFIGAVKALKADSGRYDQYVAWHVQAMNRATPPSVHWSVRNTAHRGPAFLPWHREYLRRFELDLQDISGNQDLGLPYWNWADDSADPAASPIWADDFLGGNGDPVTTGPFAHNPADPNTWIIVDDAGNPSGGLKREFNIGAPFPTQADVDGALAETPYDSSPWDTTSGVGFRNMLEGFIGPGLHNRIHMWVRGDMIPDTSPNDPVFFLHHCFIDKIWADWQTENPSEEYVPVSGEALGHNLPDLLFPWELSGATIESVWNHNDLGYVYDTDTPAAPPPPRWPRRFFRFPPVTEGDVSQWQRKMVEREFTLAVDGLYGDTSKAACIEFQQANGLVVDGIVGPVTWAATFATE